MLTDAALKRLKPKEKMYKVTDRDGMYVRYRPSGDLLPLRLPAERPARDLTIGKYGPDGLSLAGTRAVHRRQAGDRRGTFAGDREAAREAPAQGGQELRRVRREVAQGSADGRQHASHAPGDLRSRDPAVWRNRLLTEITPDDLRAHCAKIVDRGAPATAIHVRDIVKQIYGFAILHGEKVANPADEVGPASIATFTPEGPVAFADRDPDHAQADRERADAADDPAGHEALPADDGPQERVAGRDLGRGRFRECGLDDPEGADEASKPHNVYLSRQTLDIMIALKTCAGNSRYLLPSRYDADAPMSRATFNRVTYAVVERAKKEGLPLEPFTVHDLRRTGSTLLNELGFNRDWIEKCLAHEDGRSSRGVYNKAEYEHQRRHMMQEWADIVDAWVEGRKYVPGAHATGRCRSLELDPAL